MSRTLIIGVSKSGKTTLLLKKLVEMQRGTRVLISDSAPRQDIYKKNADQFDTIYKEINDHLVDRLVKQRDKTKKKKTPFLIVLDDEGDLPYLSARRNKFTSLYNSVAHYDVHIIMLLQIVTQVATTYRKNADTIYLFRPVNKTEKDQIITEFFGMYDSKTIDRLFNWAYGTADDTEKQYNFLKLTKEQGSAYHIYLNDDPEEIDPLQVD